MILSATRLTQGCDSNHEGQEAKQQGWKSHAARLLVNSNTELVFVLHPTATRSVWAALFAASL